MYRKMRLPERSERRGSFYKFFRLETYIISRKRCWKALKDVRKPDRMYSIKDGWIICPGCRSKMHGIRVTPETQARNLELRCERCKADYKLDIDSGRCFDSQRPD